MGANLYKDVITLLDQRASGGVEQHRLTNVFPPVGGIQLKPVTQRTGHGGVVGDLRGTRGNIGQRINDPSLNAVHRGAVEGVVQGQAFGKYILLAQGGFQSAELLTIARQRNAFRAVNTGQAYLIELGLF